MIICPNCGTELSDTAKFCRKCGTKIDVEEIVEAAEEHAFEEPVDSEDGSVEFNWDQPVEIEDPEDDRNKDQVDDHAEDPSEDHSEEEIEGEEADHGDEDTYEWGPPTGEGEEGDETMMPVAFAGKGSAIEEVGDKEGYGYESVIPEWDHTHEFDAEDIAENKVLAMAAYILGPIGIIIALLAAKTSPYVGFHVRQGTKFIILEAMMFILAILMCWSTVLPVVASIVLIIESIIFIILVVLKLIAFVSVCRNKAVEPPVIRSLGFMK